MQRALDHTLAFHRRRGERHLLVRELGRGGLAHVYLAARQSSQGFLRWEAVKFLNESSREEPECRQALLEEGWLAAQLRHPHVVETWDVVEQEPDQDYIVMEMLEGRTLRELLRADVSGEFFPLPLRVALFRDLLRGLDYIHHACDYRGRPLQLVHRDLSPDNLFVTFDGQVKIIDFGIANFDGNRHVTENNLIKGKVAYLAPERLERAPERVDARADLFSAGVILYRLLTGAKLWDGLSDVQILAALQRKEIPPLQALAALGPEWERLGLDALAAHPEDRIESAAVFLEELSLLSPEQPSSQMQIAARMEELWGEQRRQFWQEVEEVLERETETGKSHWQVSAREPEEQKAQLSWLARGQSQVAKVSQERPQEEGLSSFGKTALGALVGGLVVFCVALLGDWFAELEEAPRPSALPAAPVLRGEESGVQVELLDPSLQIYVDGVALPAGIREIAFGQEGKRHRLQVRQTPASSAPLPEAR